MSFFEIFAVEFVNTSYPQKFRSRDEGLELELDFGPMNCQMSNGTKKTLDFITGVILDPIKFGFSITVHDPYEIGSKKHTKFRLILSEHAEFAVTPKIMKIHESLIDAPINE
jgi:hypothetical protein